MSRNRETNYAITTQEPLLAPWIITMDMGDVGVRFEVGCACGFTIDLGERVDLRERRLSA